MSWIQRAALWLAANEVQERTVTAMTDAHRRGYDKGVADGYATGWNTAMRTMKQQMEDARAELEFVRALFPLHPSHKTLSKRVH